MSHKKPKTTRILIEADVLFGQLDEAELPHVLRSMGVVSGALSYPDFPEEPGIAWTIPHREGDL